VDLGPADSINVPPARWTGFPMLPDGRFPIAAYAGPTGMQSTEFRYVEMQQAGIDLTLKTLDESGSPESNGSRIAIGARHNIWSLVADKRTMVPDRAYSPGWKADLDSSVTTFHRRDGMLGYFLAEDPNPQDFASLAAINRRLSQLSQSALAVFTDYPGQGLLRYGMPYTSYLRRYIEQAHPAMFAVRSYPLLKATDNAYYVTTWDSAAYVSRLTSTPFWGMLLLSPYKQYRVPTSAELSWQAFLPMAYGARGIVWFTYWTPSPTDPAHYHDGPITFDGHRTAAYGRLVDVNERIQLLGQEIGNMQWQGVRHLAPVPYGCRAFRPSEKLRVESKTPVAIGFFKQMSGATFGLFVNRDYKKVASVQIFAPDTLLRWTRASGLYRVLDAKPAEGAIQNQLIVGPGDAELVRLPASFDYLTTQ
jgi:hypothetical protein